MPAIERRREFTCLGSDLGETSIWPAMSQSCFGDKRRGMSGNRDVSPTIFITSISGSKSLPFFACRFFHFRKPPGLRFAVVAAEKNGKFGCIPLPEKPRD